MAENGQPSDPISPAVLAAREEFRTMVAGLVRIHRDAEGWSQAELGRRVGVSRWTISQLELGNVVVGFDVLLQLFKIFIPLSELENTESSPGRWTHFVQAAWS